MRTKHILYAEDEPDDLVIFKKAFKRATLPHTLHSVEDGQAAIHWLEGKDQFANREEYPLPDILVVDLKMPKKGGFDVLEWVRKRVQFENLPIIVLSSSDDPDDVKRAYKLGATNYFAKSHSFQDIIQYLRLSS